MPDEVLPIITIHFARTGKPTRTFHDGFIEDDGKRLKTFSILPAEIGASLSRNFQEEKLLEAGQQISGVEKFMFYREYFSIMQFVDSSRRVLGVYTDIATPLVRVGQEYHLTDLCLDLWLAPERKIFILDEDEFERAVKDGTIDSRLARTARLTLERLLGEVEAGIFPGQYTL